MKNSQNNNPSHSLFLQQFLERNVRDIQKSLKQRNDELKLALEIQSALKKERKPKDASVDMSVEIYSKSVMKLDFVLQWLDIQLENLNK